MDETIINAFCSGLPWIAHKEKQEMKEGLLKALKFAHKKTNKKAGKK